MRNSHGIGAALLLISLSLSQRASAQAASEDPSPPTMIHSHAGIGVMPFYPIYFDRPHIGIEVYATMRPSFAKYFYPELEKHNIGIHLNFSYLEMKENFGFYELDLVFRKYFSRIQHRLGEDSAFFGLGIGVAGILWNSSYVTRRDIVWIAELGYEYRVISDIVATIKTQAHRITVGAANFTGFSIVLSLGWRFES